MYENTEITLKTVCCTCLSIDRKLTQLSRINDGLNKLFFLLSYDSEAYEAVFHKDAIKLFICWECNALIERVCRFRDQVCTAQKQLSDIADGKINMKLKKISLSHLTHYHQNTYNKEYNANDETFDNFIDCGPDIDYIKTESDNDDIPLSNLKKYSVIITEAHLEDKMKNTGTRLTKKRKKLKCKNYCIIQMSDEEMRNNIGNKKLIDSYVNASNRCESCVEGFKDYNQLEKHNLELHFEKPNHIQCDICQIFIKQKLLEEHKNGHYYKYKCNSCDHISCDLQDLSMHMKMNHSIDIITKKIRKKITEDSESKQNDKTAKDDATEFGFLCTECNKYFENRNRRYKHIQKYHREGFKCSTCGKRFAFKNTLNRHEQLHKGPPPREQCPTCGKMVRCDLLRSHSRTHALRQSHDCRACDKRFVSRASYESHLKYSSRHAVHDVLKYKCTMCEKGYRSRAELRDHANYQHMGRTQHKCPICNKALANRRCITRHVRRAHHGVKENAKDKICQTCGKAFRDKKCLREHELIHTGERPLTCNICGRSFRQSASLYTHKRRVHNVGPKQRVVVLSDCDKNNEINAQNYLFFIFNHNHDILKT